MSLNFEYNRVEDWKKIDEGVRYAMPFVCMAVGIGSITEKNWELFARRADFLQKLHGGFLTGERQYITADDVKACIGLWTNASFKDETTAQFTKRHLKWLKL